MPCYDERNEPEYIIKTKLEPLRNKVKKLEAMLCALSTALLEQEHPIGLKNTVDWKEAGVSYEEYRAWWTKHKEEDRERKLKEQEKRRVEQERQNVLRKLSEREKKLLGLK